MIFKCSTEMLIFLPLVVYFRTEEQYRCGMAMRREMSSCFQKHQLLLCLCFLSPMILVLPSHSILPPYFFCHPLLTLPILFSLYAVPRVLSSLFLDLANTIHTSGIPVFPVQLSLLRNIYVLT